MDLNNILGIVGIALLSGIAYFIKGIVDKVNNTMTESEIRILIADKLQPITERHNDIKEDLARLEDKLDYLIKLLADHKF